jgi:hypothetical protein
MIPLHREPINCQFIQFDLVERTGWGPGDRWMDIKMYA